MVGICGFGRVAVRDTEVRRDRRVVRGLNNCECFTASRNPAVMIITNRAPPYPRRASPRTRKRCNKMNASSSAPTTMRIHHELSRPSKRIAA